jgi:hypothetical protein
MFIILIRDNFWGYQVVKDYLGLPKRFEAESECIDYCKEKEIDIFQPIEVTI